MIRTLCQQLVYPVMLFCLLVFLTLLFVFVIVPSYSQFFDSMSIQVPLVIRVLNQRPFLGVVSMWIWGIIGGGMFFFFRILYRWGMKMLFSRHHSDLLWMMGVLLDFGVSLSSILESADDEGKRLESKLLETGSFSEAWGTVFSLNKYDQLWLKSAESQAAFPSMICELARHIRQSRYQFQLKCLKVVQPLSLLVVALFIFALVCGLYLPIIYSMDQVSIH